MATQPNASGTAQEKSGFDNKPSQVLNMIHFNDVYHVKPDDDHPKIGGAARLKTFIDTIVNNLENDKINSKPLICFRGDFLSPSRI